MIRTLTLNRRSNNNMEGVLQVIKSPNHERHSLQAWPCDQESSEYDDGSGGGDLLSAQVAAARLASSSSPDSGPSESDLLEVPPELQTLDSGSSLLSNDVSSSNATANFLLPKATSIWGTGDSEYSCWAQESLSRSSGSVDDSSLLSSDTLGNETSRLMETSKPTTESLMAPHWPLPNSQSSPQVFHRRSWQTSADEPTSLGILIPNINLQTCSNTFPALSSSASGLDASKFNMDYLGERSMGNFEATSSVYDSMARKIQNQMSGLDTTASSGADCMTSMGGFSAFQQMGQSSLGPGHTTESNDVNNVSSANGLFWQQGIMQHQQQHKNYSVSPMDHDKSYLTSNSHVFFNHSSGTSTLDTTNALTSTSSATSNQRFGENMNSPKLLFESISGNSVLNISSPSESVLGSHNYLYSTQKKVDPLESLRNNKWPNNATGKTGLGNLGRFSYSPTRNGDNEDGLYNDSTWPPSSVAQSISMDPGVLPVDIDSRKRFLHMTLGKPSNNNISISHKRLHMETQHGQTTPPASAKRSSSWASSLTSTCAKAQDSVTPGSSLPCNNTKSNSRHAVGPALNTNLKPRARQGSANDPQSIAARHRRERISERLKVLQDLVPNGSKVDLVTMLEKAINYVKFLQLQVKVLTTDDYWPSNEKGAAPCTAIPNFEDMEGALKVLVAQVEKEANSNSTTNNNSSNKNLAKSSPDPESQESGSPGSSDSM